ncbi:alpha-ketoglutarate-dependent dioxygenase AlkB [Flavobacteriaceae bacterium LSUCC0859]|nr:alpha-ketoglutarate-dependent dioxygenase AlkB [Flavobacteriaceae bacterium LSUCC0859]
MDLFSSEHNSKDNLLPKDGEVHYHGPIFSSSLANEYYDKLLTEIAWAPDQALIFGKLITTKREVAWYADKAYSYTYSKITKKALLWTPLLLQIKAAVEKVSGETYNACLLNLYHNGSQGMAWHSDGEKDLKKNGAIASVSFGAQRKFAFKHKEDKAVVAVPLEHGSLLVMKGSTQSHWLHRLPPTKKIHSPRINLTFRTIVGT